MLGSRLTCEQAAGYGSPQAVLPHLRVRTTEWGEGRGGGLVGEKTKENAGVKQSIDLCH
jgi:hypothetical protein